MPSLSRRHKAKISASLRRRNRQKQSYWYGVWYEGRNTPDVKWAAVRKQAIADSRSGTNRRGKPAGYQASVLSARRLKGKSLRDVERGKWVRERYDGTYTGGDFRYRPHMKSRATTVLR